MFRVKQSGSRWLSRAATLAGLIAIPQALGAQSCPLCYQSAASGGPQFIQALRNGILILFIPPFLIFGAIFYAAYRKRDQFNTTEGITRIEFEFDEPDNGQERPLDAGEQLRLRAKVADTIEL